ncbi:MAG: hypothetical protein ABI763_14110, partial [Bacteroidota bacterium]
WLIATSSGSVSDLFSNIRYEGHPCLWYLVLFIASKISSNIVMMQSIHLCIAISTVYLIFKYAPFKTIEKVLLVFGYFFLYEYCVISRNYAISVLLITLLCISSRRNNRMGMVEGILLFALCNTNIYGAFIAGVFSLYILLMMYEHRNDSSYLIKSLVPSAFIVAGFISLYVQVRPASLMQYNEYYKWNRGFDLIHLRDTIAKLFDVYFPVPSFRVSGSFGKNIVADAPLVKSIIALVAFALACVTLKKNHALLILYAAGTTAILGVLYFNTHTSLRHEGFLFLLLVIVMWFYRNARDSTKSAGTFSNRFFMFILIIQCIGGCIAIGKEIAYPFSNLQAAGRFVVSNEYDKVDISGLPDYVISPISAFTHKPVYSAETGTLIRFIRWNDEREESNDAIVKIFARADSLVKNGMSKAIIVLNKGLVDSLQQPLESFPINDSALVTFAKKFDKPSLVADEKYYFYEVTKRK